MRSTLSLNRGNAILLDDMSFLRFSEKFGKIILNKNHQLQNNYFRKCVQHNNYANNTSPNENSFFKTMKFLNDYLLWKDL